MSELTLLLIRIAYLAVLWIFVLSAISVIRSDMFGARVPETARTPEPRGRESKPKKPDLDAKTREEHLFAFAHIVGVLDASYVMRAVQGEADVEAVAAPGQSDDASRGALV